VPYFSTGTNAYAECYFDVIDAMTGLPIPYVKSVDTDIGLVEEVEFDGVMVNGRPRPILRHDRLVTRSSIRPFDLVDKFTGNVLHRVRPNRST
jgi:hypothetical protein